ncbi:MAG: single-stranded-DNA-specific exonuclease RecJ [Hyphomicrobiaceae bacterium]|nr:single-stranded-DNA-specific exonuclease RecJ [Hyphomicrobiaceae bacterium]
MGALRRLRPEPAIDQRSAFLGVTRSARGLRWRERIGPADLNLATAICQRHDLPELLGRVLAARGVALDEVPIVLDPTIKALMPDPSVLQDMDKAAARLADAIIAGEAIAVFGDYDVDGAASVALLHRFLAHHGLGCRVYIPDRLFEGYGPNAAAIERLAADGARLIVTVDCGTTSFEPLGIARKLGADVVVIDHHQADERLPDVHALVNPNRQDDLSGLGQLSAAGVTFMALVAASRELRRRGFYSAARPAPDLLGLLDLVALATVCDVVPLTGLNRAYVVKGLHVMRSRRNIGLKALFDAAGLDQAPTPYHLGFVLGPRINAGGRIGDAALGARLLAGEDELEAARIAQLLDKLNKERKAIETAMLEQAMAEAERQLEADPELPILVLGSESWHKGVVGLVSSRLTERFRRPSCVISWEQDAGTASLRSVAGVDIGGAVRAAAASGHVVKGGGHAMAAGLTVERTRLEPLKAFLAAQLGTSATLARAAAGLDIDGAVTAAGATDDLVQLIERAGPYGQGNPQPRFAFPAHRIRNAKIVGERHVRFALEAGDGSRRDAVAFRAAGQPLGETLLGAGGLPLHVAGTLRRDTWGGRDRIEVTIDDAADPRHQG